MNRFELNFNKHFYLVVFLASAAYYYALLFVFEVQTDIQKHTEFAIWMLRGGKIPSTFFYFGAISLVALLRDDHISLLAASLIVLSWASV